MNTPCYALFCLHRTHMEGCENFARRLIEEHGFSILSVGDVADYLTKKDIPNIQVTTTLYGLAQIDVVYLTLNETELRNERNRAGRTLESCRQLIDVQGPALLHSAVHGGKIAISSSQWENMALEALSGDSGAHSRLNHCAMTAISGYYQEVDRVYLTFFQDKVG